MKSYNCLRDLFEQCLHSHFHWRLHLVLWGYPSSQTTFNQITSPHVHCCCCSTSQSPLRTSQVYRCCFLPLSSCSDCLKCSYSLSPSYTTGTSHCSACCPTPYPCSSASWYDPPDSSLPLSSSLHPPHCTSSKLLHAVNTRWTPYASPVGHHTTGWVQKRCQAHTLTAEQ